MSASPLSPSKSGRPRRRPVPGRRTAVVTPTGVLATASPADGSSGDDSASDGGPVTLQLRTDTLKCGDPAAKTIVDEYHREPSGVTIRSWPRA
ncbi:hypothetical protein AB5J49_02240 [Streptomyces sp. R28]|uniref:Uncharacterized protein n=1 Tax=Streptomyces sp. R28 TaxID=3238628 RepID=A0AB39PMZ4_9ACTN